MPNPLNFPNKKLKVFLNDEKLYFGAMALGLMALNI
jgi:hypothetical protein